MRGAWDLLPICCLLPVVARAGSLQGTLSALDYLLCSHSSSMAWVKRM